MILKRHANISKSSLLSKSFFFFELSQQLSLLSHDIDYLLFWLFKISLYLLMKGIGSWGSVICLTGLPSVRSSYSLILGMLQILRKKYTYLEFFWSTFSLNAGKYRPKYSEYGYFLHGATYDKKIYFQFLVCIRKNMIRWDLICSFPGISHWLIQILFHVWMVIVCSV